MGFVVSWLGWACLAKWVGRDQRFELRDQWSDVVLHAEITVNQVVPHIDDGNPRYFRMNGLHIFGNGPGGFPNYFDKFDQGVLMKLALLKPFPVKIRREGLDFTSCQEHVEQVGFLHAP